MASRSVGAEREGRPLHREHLVISAVRKPGGLRRGGDARKFDRLKRAIRKAERRSGDGCEIAGTGATILRFRATTTVNSVQTSLSLTSATQDLTNGRYTYTPGFGTTGFANPLTAKAGPVRFSLSATTTIFLTVVGTFSASTLSAYGILHARRRR